ncbi:hypothetical protein HanIR_Chr02g0055531 [Helianthus annuus]|nr:hypothetical protein HanIR_Chr02g0055531 [Helianthus annuus]
MPHKRNRHHDDKMTNLNRSSPNLRLVPPNPLNDFRDLGIRHWRHPLDQAQACLGFFIQTARSARSATVRSTFLTPVNRFLLHSCAFTSKVGICPSRAEAF